MQYVIFDLDHTVIDSSHRQLTLPDGSLDLAHWRENCTRDKIFADSLLPLARIMQQHNERGDFVIICTARMVTQHDLDYLEAMGLDYRVILKRDEGDERGDAAMKVALLTELAELLAYDSVADMRALMYDDNARVIDAMRALGVACFDAIEHNNRLRRNNKG